ncbi:1-phosphofructokinase [Frisingicoccus caecimuris]|uniref:Tagatose-6-phosphate kinase n=1 Tax=Frisingicoccus caecimuris TaxID=1796636 RepID=A0A4R2LBW9_9FIRM|nr:1-phosphofructokinase [Frisingicoccus caecimuris]MCR1919541.1 1-phosphofructokinase [Frisingicoccus caecimuris]TCO83896.1 fructose-1-phosphate kinase [Frisingicoccus caecimuris]
MIYTVTFNPALDYIVRVEQFNVGEVNRAAYSEIMAGGKGVNVSLVLKNLGHESTALGFAAGFTGEKLVRDLKDKGCRTNFIFLEQGMTRINVKIKGQEETEINGEGPEITPMAIRAMMIKLERLREGDILILSGSIPKTLPEDIYEKVIVRQQGKNVRIVVDATKNLLKETLEYHPFLIKPNHHELGELFGVTISNPEEALSYAEKLQQMGAVNVLVSMAGEGAVLLDEYGNKHMSPAPEGRLVNSVGAGDSMVAGFIAGYLETKDYEQAFRMGIAAGSASAFSEFLATREETMEVLEKTFK